MGKELATHIVRVAIVVRRYGYQRVVGLVDVVLVLRLGVKQGLVGTGAVLAHRIGRKGVQYGQCRVGVFVHQRLGTMQGISHRFGVVAGRQQGQQQE